MLHGIEEKDIKRVLLASDNQWRQVRHLTVDGKSFRFRDLDSGQTIAGPLPSIIAVEGLGVPTEDEIAEAEYQRQFEEQEEERRFQWTHYGSSEEHAALVEAQANICPGCDSVLTGPYANVHTHVYQGQVLCHVCTPLQLRYLSHLPSAA